MMEKDKEKEKYPPGCREDDRGGGPGNLEMEKKMGKIISATDGSKKEEMEKKKKQDSTPSPDSGSGATYAFGDLNEEENEEYGRIVCSINSRFGRIEGFDWDMDTIIKKIDHYHKSLNPGPDYRDFQVCYEEPQLKKLKKRLALYYIRAHEDAQLRQEYPSVEDEDYIEFYENSFKWYFDKDYCCYSRLQDYQRLMLHNYGKYEEWEFYRETCNTLEGDQQFVQWWEEINEKTEWIRCCLNASHNVWHRLESVACYHALKIAAGFPKIYGPLVTIGYSDYLWVVRLDEDTSVNCYCDLFYSIWLLVTKDKMNYKEALRQAYVESRQYSVFRPDMKADVEKLDGKKIGGPGAFQRMFEQYVAKIDGGVTERGFYKLMRPIVRDTIIPRKVYHDYAREKLDIAKQIGMIQLHLPLGVGDSV